jgi:putative hydrolase of the HAD superfamily
MMLNSIKILLVDADGVALKKSKYFSEIYSQEYNVPAEKIILFFKNEFRDCQLGKADLLDALPSYLKDWGWQGSVDEFIKFWFESNTIADDAVISKIQELRTRGIKCYLATDQEKYRAGYILDNLGFDKKIDGSFFSFEIGHSKSESEFFQTVLNHLGLNAAEIGYLDDEQENVEVASKLGIQAKLYQNIADFELLHI